MVTRVYIRSNLGLTLRKHIQKYKHTHHLLHPAPSTHLQHVREHTVVNTNTNILLAPPTSDAPTPHVLCLLLCACAGLTPEPEFPVHGPKNMTPLSKSQSESSAG